MFSTCSRLKLVLTCVDAVLTTGDSPLTVMLSASVLTLSWGLISTVAPTPTMMPPASAW